MSSTIAHTRRKGAWLGLFNLLYFLFLSHIVLVVQRPKYTHHWRSKSWLLLIPYHQMTVLVFWGLILAFCISFALLKWSDLKYRRKRLPRGTMGWPLFGETVDFLKYGPDFMKKQSAKWAFIMNFFLLLLF